MLTRHLFLSLTLLAATPSCRQASFKIVKPDAAASPTDTGPGEPFNGGPGSGKSGDGTAGPTARVEVIAGGISVTSVRVGVPTLLRPSADTLDPDDVGKSTCANPGIVKAAYTVNGAGAGAVDRGDRCEGLATPHTFDQPGDYKIGLIVTSNENETAAATMTLHVIAGNASADDDGGFTIVADPLLPKVNQAVAFSGICTTAKAHVTSWQFGDGASGTGETTSHPYAQPGSYVVQALCTEQAPSPRSWQASVTVVVMTNPPANLPAPGPAPHGGDPGTVVPGGGGGPTPPPPSPPPATKGGGTVTGSTTTGGACLPAPSHTTKFCGWLPFLHCAP